MMRLLYILTFFLLPLMIHAQPRSTKIVGSIKDEKGIPVPHVSIHLKKTSYATVTDQEGRFSLVAPVGEYEFTASALGYVTYTTKITLLVGELKRIHISPFKENTSELNQVVVEGKSAIQEVRETPFNVVALDAKSQYNSTMNLTDLLSKASGVKIRESGGVGSDVNIAINGFTGRHVKVFMDGVPMQGNSSSFQLNNIPVSLAERIEVYKGVVPIEFGADAIGGVINIVTNQTTNSFLDASYSYGSFNTHRTNIALGHTTKKGFSLQLNAYQTYSDNNYQIKARAYLFDNNKYERENSWYKRFHGAYHNEAVVVKAGVVNKPWADRFFVGATLSQDYKEIQNSAGNVQIVYGEPTASKKGFQPNLEYYKRNLFTEGLTVRISGNYNFNNNNNVDTSSYEYNWQGLKRLSLSKGEMGTMALSDYKNSNYATTANVSYRINDQHSITLNDVQSGSVRKITSTAPEEDLTTFEKLRRLSLKNVLGLSYRYRYSRNWNVNVFGKNYYQQATGPFNAADEAHPDWQERSASYNTTGYGIATTYFLKDYQFKASMERAYRLPTDNELFGDEIEEQGNATLKAENSMNYNLGVTLNRSLNNKNVLYIDVNGFYRNTKDFIQREILVRTGQLTSVNHGLTKNLGVDVEARYYFKNIAMIGGTVTYQDLRDKERNRESGGTAESAHYNDRMPNTPYFYANADAAYYLHNLGGKGNVLNLNYSLNYVGEFYLYWESLGVIGGDKATYPVQLSHDLSATYSLKNGRYNFTLEAKNITGAELSDNFGMLKPGRAIYGKFRYYLIKRK